MRIQKKNERKYVMSVLWNKFSSQEKHGKRNHIFARCMKSKTYGLFVSHFSHISSVLTDRFWEDGKCLSFQWRFITFYLSYFCVCQLEEDCLKWLKIIPESIKTRHKLENLKNNREILIESHNFMYDIVFQIPWKRILAMKGNST